MIDRIAKGTSFGRRRRTLICILVLARYSFSANGWSPLKLATRTSFPEQSRSRQGIRRVLKKFVPFSSSNDDTDVSLLQSENYVLRDTIRQLEEENQKLKQKAKIVLENFEGERLFRGDDGSLIQVGTGSGITLTGDEIAQDELWCDELDGGEQTIRLLPRIFFSFFLYENSYFFFNLSP